MGVPFHTRRHSRLHLHSEYLLTYMPLVDPERRETDCVSGLFLSLSFPHQYDYAKAIGTLDMMVQACHDIYLGGQGRRIARANPCLSYGASSGIA